MEIRVNGNEILEVSDAEFAVFSEEYKQVAEAMQNNGSVITLGEWIYSRKTKPVMSWLAKAFNSSNINWRGIE